MATKSPTKETKHTERKKGVISEVPSSHSKGKIREGVVVVILNWKGAKNRVELINIGVSTYMNKDFDSRSLYQIKAKS